MAKVRELLFQSHNPYENLDLLPFNNHGWASGHPAFAEVIATIRPKLIIEVGTWLGGSARTMARECLAQGIEDFEIVCVDTFLGSVERWDRSSYLMDFKNGRSINYEQFLSNTVHAGYQNYTTPFPVDSQNAALTLQKFGVVADLVYIDAGHDYDSVKNDLQNFSKILRSGGILLGDDWFHPPIQRAVYDVFGAGVEDRGNVKYIWRKP